MSQLRPCRLGLCAQVVEIHHLVLPFSPNEVSAHYADTIGFLTLSILNTTPAAPATGDIRSITDTNQIRVAYLRRFCLLNLPMAIVFAPIVFGERS